jgi:hypothetical protein
MRWIAAYNDEGVVGETLALDLDTREIMLLSWNSETDYYCFEVLSFEDFKTRLHEIRQTPNQCIAGCPSKDSYYVESALAEYNAWLDRLEKGELGAAPIGVWFDRVQHLSRLRED